MKRIYGKYIVSIEFNVYEQDSVKKLREFFDLDNFGNLKVYSVPDTWRGVYFEIYENSLTVAIRKYSSWFARDLFLKNYDILKLIRTFRELNLNDLTIKVIDCNNANICMTLTKRYSYWEISNGLHSTVVGGPVGIKLSKQDLINLIKSTLASAIFMGENVKAILNEYLHKKENHGVQNCLVTGHR